MPDQASRLDEGTLERLFSWVRLFRGVGAAIDAKKLILAMLGLLLYQAGREGLDRLFPGTPRGVGSWEWAVGIGSEPTTLSPLHASLPADLRAAPWRLTEPVRSLVGPFLALFSLGHGWGAFFGALAAAVWGTVVWGIFGGAIARIAVAQVARSERIGIAEALRFARSKSLPLIGTPLCPLLGIAFFTAFCAVLGLLYRLPLAAGPVAAGLLAIFPLLAGLVMAIILFSLAAGWPLMHATVAAEGEDGFDALSRSFAYVNQRPLRYAFCVALAWALGILGVILVDLFARTTVHMAQWALGFGAPAGMLATLFQSSPATAAPAAAAVPAARAVHGFWLSLVGLAAHGWIYSYFWTSAVIIYLILRQDVDGTPWHVMAPAERRACEFDLDPTQDQAQDPQASPGTSPTTETAPPPASVPADAPVHS